MVKLINEDDFIETLILNGALEVSAIDMNTNEPLYRFTPKLKKVSPELYDANYNMFYEDLMFLWQEGFIEVDLELDNPFVRLTQKVTDEESVNKLDKVKRFTLMEIIKIISEQD